VKEKKHTRTGARKVYLAAVPAAPASLSARCQIRGPSGLFYEKHPSFSNRNVLVIEARGEGDESAASAVCRVSVSVCVCS
jgi:hypothetical protein